MSERDDEVQRALGRIEGHIEGIHKTLSSVDTRLSGVESEAVRQGGRKGGEIGAYVSLGVAIVAEAIRQAAGLKPGG